MSSGSKLPKHLEQIDALRGLAILMVFFFHCQLILVPAASGPPLKQALLLLSPTAYGWVGVPLFFIISGFLIHLGTISNHFRLNIGTYLSKRFWRIYIPFWLVLSLFIISAYLEGAERRPDITNILLHVFTLHDLSEKYFYGINPSFWSLGTEIKLYLLYPLFLWLRKRYGISHSFFAVCLLGLAMAGFGILFKGVGRSLVYQKSVFQLWFIWCAGAYYAEVFYNNQRLLFKRHKALLALLAYILLIICDHRIELNPFAFFPATVLMLVLFEHIISNSFPGKWQLPMRLVALIGLCSYSLYLIHQPFLSRLLDVFGANLGSPLRFFSTIPALLLLSAFAYLMYWLVEVPSTAIGYKIRKLNITKFGKKL